jgi:hypothetical protein
MAVFWDVLRCSLVELHQRFRATCCLHHQRHEDPDDGGSKGTDSHLYLTSFTAHSCTKNPYFFHLNIFPSCMNVLSFSSTRFPLCCTTVTQDFKICTFHLLAKSTLIFSHFSLFYNPMDLYSVSLCRHRPIGYFEPNIVFYGTQHCMILVKATCDFYLNIINAAVRRTSEMGRL